MTDDYFARPGQPLDEHLDGVVANTRELVPAEATTLQGDSLRDLTETVAHLHDIGKLTPAFQAYIRDQPDRPANQSEYHAAPGALVTLHALAAQEFSPAASLAGFYAVLRHHQALPDMAEYHKERKRKGTRYKTAGKKLQKIDQCASGAADARLHSVTDVLDWEDVFVGDDTQQYQQTVSEHNIGESFYPLLQRVWATLNCADKLDAAASDDGLDAAGLLSGSVSRPDHERVGFENDTTGIEYKLNEQRSQAQSSVAERLSTLAESETNVFTLTLPTGFGKTFAGLKAALQRAEHIDGRVVYALPYTTVLDQVDDEIRRQFVVSPTSAAYTLHHHLADTRTEIASERNNEGETVSDGTEMLYAESWQSGLVLTTFVQLFESLAGPANRQSMKLPALRDSVIVLDEPQVLPREWWRLVTHLVDVLVTRYDATVVLMTATQPRFIEQSAVDLDPAELVADPGPDHYFGFLDTHERVRFEIDDSVPAGDGPAGDPVTPAAAADRLLEETLTDGGSTLTIANTVQSASDLWHAVGNRPRSDSVQLLALGTVVKEFVTKHGGGVTDWLDGGESVEEIAETLAEDVRVRVDDGDTDLLAASLTAALRPADRKLLIALISSLLEGTDSATDDCPLLVVSTQLIEAGVDLSFERVYRDFAPVPSIAQAAGRCNRSFETARGRVVVWRLSSPAHDTPPCRLIYDRGGDRLSPTSAAFGDVLTGDRRVPEYAMITDGVKTYYDRLHGTDHREHDRDRLVKEYTSANAETLRQESLIDDHSEDVLVLCSDTERDVLAQYLAAKAGRDFDGGRASLATLQQLFASVPEDRASVLDESDTIAREMGFDSTLDEFAVVDARDGPAYDLVSGAGLRDIK